MSKSINTLFDCFARCRDNDRTRKPHGFGHGMYKCRNVNNYKQIKITDDNYLSVLMKTEYL